jgi:hypothetical protein
MNAPLIALYSDVPQSGKSTVADMLVRDHGYVRLKFAGPLKDMARSLLKPLVGEDLERYIEGDLKNAVIPGLAGDLTARRIMQTLGTEWGRSLDENLWVDLAMAEANALRAKGIPVVIDDMRFQNEYEAVIRDGGYHIEVRREAAIDAYYAAAAVPHVSEGALATFPFDAIIYNDDGLEYLRGAVNALAQNIDERVAEPELPLQ